MRLPYYTKKDGLIIAGVLPIAVLVINYWIFGRRYFSEITLFACATALGCIVGFISWYLQIIVAIVLQKKYPEYNQTVKRLLISLSLYIVITSATIYGIFWLYAALPIFQYQLSFVHLMASLITGALVDVLSASFHEGVAFYERWKKATDEAEQLKQQHLQTQLESLKSQVNPHFLFNSLNSLSSLISDNPAKAEKFLDELSKVYRYLLRNNENILTTLQAELQFIQSYYHLLKTRYGDSLLLQMDINEDYRAWQLPPLTLQLLVENAVKHNIMVKQMPLQITITAQHDKLEVCNNLQRKLKQADSSRVGLANIGRKYKLLKQEDIVVTEEEERFRVVIPLIKPEW